MKLTLRIKLRLLICISFFTGLLNFYANAQELLQLYPDKIPNSKPFKNIEDTTRDNEGRLIIRNISVPTLQVFLPAGIKTNSPAVIIFPGGGYWVNAYKHEGTDVANAFNKAGVAAFVLKYRLPDDRWMIDAAKGPIQDAQQAILMLIENASRWNIDTSKIGVMGFSAGAHLAGLAATAKHNLIENDSDKKINPSFIMLIYPMVSADTLINPKGVIEKLLGKNPSRQLMDEYSVDKRISSASPPAFVVQAADDWLTIKNSLLFADAQLKHERKIEMHIYQGGGHGFGLHNPATNDKWFERCINWMKAGKWLE